MAKLRHTGILVYDLKTALDLYCSVLGFKEIGRGVIRGKFAETLFNLENLYLTYVKLKSKGCSTRLELWHIKGLLPTQTKNIGYSHVALTVKDLDSLYEKLRERKLAFFSPPVKAEDSDVKLCFCRDHDGNILELVEDKRLKS